MMLTARMSPSDELGFERYLRDSYASLVARLRGRFSERVAAEDVVQEALLRAWQMDTRGERIRALEPWMTAVATNLARSRWRTMNAEDRALEKLAMDRSSDPSQVLQSPSAAGFVGPVASAIAQLSSRQRQVVVLHYYGDFAVGEIAGRLGVSEGTVKRTLHDARRALRRLVGAQHELQTPRRRTMPGWHMAGSHPGQYDHGLAEGATYEGKPVARLRCSVRRADGFGTLMQTFSAEDFLEQRVRFSGVLECDEVEGWVGMWMRVDGERGAQPLAFDNMKNRSIRGTTPWTRYEVVLDVPVQAQAITLGVLLKGEGEVRMADFAVETVGSEVQTTETGMDVLPDRPQNLDFSGELDL